MKIGVLALQGDFSEHINKLSGIGASAVAVRLPADLDGLSGAILPGGESTTFRKLASAYGLIEPLREFGKTHALWGTCAGAIALAKQIGRGGSHPRVDGYHHRTQRLRTPGGLLRNQSGYPGPLSRRIPIRTAPSTACSSVLR